MDANIAGLTKNVESLARFGWVKPGLKAKYLEAVETFDPTTANKSTIASINEGANHHALTPVMAGIHTVIGTVAR